MSHFRVSSYELKQLISSKNPFWVFNGTGIGSKEEFHDLCEQLAEHHELVELLKFTDNDECFEFDNERLFTTLLCCDYLKVLDLSRNGLKDHFAKYLTGFLKQNFSCVSLKLAYNRFTAAGLKTMAAGLRTNPVLLNLDLTQNKLKVEGVEILGTILKTNTVLETVTISRCGFDSTGEEALMKGLDANRTLRVLEYTHISNKLQKITKRLHENNLLWREKFLKDLKNEQKGKWNRSKLMFIGQGRAGKTSTVNRLLHKGFDKSQDSTVGASVSQTQTSTTQDQKWKQVSENDAAYLGKGMKEDLARATIAARKIVNRNDKNRDKQRDEMKKRHLQRQKELQEQRARQAKLNRERGGYTDTGGVEFGEYGNAMGDIGNKTQDELLAQALQREEMDLFNERGGKGGDEKLMRQLQEEERKRKEKDEEEDENAKLYADAVFKAARETKDSITFSLWDYGGQTVFYALHHLFLTKYGIYVLCVDMREILVKPEVAKQYLLFWLNSVKLHAPTAPVLLVGTHMDALEDKELLVEIDQFIKTNFAEKFKQLICLQKDQVFYPVDNKNNVGLNYLRFDIERVSRMQEFVTAEVSLKWLFCLDKMMVERDTGGEQPSWLKLSRVRGIAEKVNLKKQEELEKMLNLFHELGVLVRLTGTEELRSLVTLDPQWLIDGLCRVIRDNKLHGFSAAELEKAGLTDEVKLLYDKGLASMDVMRYLWKGEEYKDHHQFFLDLMKHMVLISDWDFREEKMFVIPSLLTPRYEETDLFESEHEKVKKEKAKKIEQEKSKEAEAKPDGQEAEDDEEEKVPEERKKETKHDFAVFDFKKIFLPLGVFQRLVCLCVSYSTTVGDSGNRVKEPELYERHAKIWMGSDTILYLEQRSDEIWLSVEEPSTAPTCFKAVNSMLNKLNADLMGSGLQWDVTFRVVNKIITQKADEEKAHVKEVTEKELTEQKARKSHFEPWFEKAKEDKPKAADLLNLESFIDAF